MTKFEPGNFHTFKLAMKNRQISQMNKIQAKISLRKTAHKNPATAITKLKIPRADVSKFQEKSPNALDDADWFHARLGRKRVRIVSGNQGLISISENKAVGKAHCR